MKTFKVIECKESTSTPGTFRLKTSYKDSSLPSFIKSSTVYISGNEEVAIDTEFSVPADAVKIEPFDYTIPSGDQEGEVITLKRAIFL